jgi:tRNA-specific 2-thiouridylase
VTKKTPQTPPLFVVKKDVQANTITVAPKVARRKKEGSRIFLHDVNWIVKREHECLARFRYNQELFPVTVLDTDGKCVVLPHSTQSYIAQGQSMVFYKEGVCLGGGVIGYM